MPPRVTATVLPKTPAATPAVKRATANEPDSWGKNYHRIMIYGDAKSGKSSWCGTIPGRGMWIQPNTKMSGGELVSIDTPENRARIDPRFLSSADRAKEILDEAASGGYDFVVLDHITGLRDRFIAEVAGLDEIPVQKRWGTLQQQQYIEVSEKVKTVVAKLCEIPCHVVIISQQGDMNDKADNLADSDLIKPLIGPAMPKKLQNYVLPLVFHIVQTFKRPRYEETTELMIPGDPSTAITKRVRAKGVDYCLRTGPHDLYYTGFRLPVGNYLPDEIVNPTFEKFQAVIDGTYLDRFGE